MFRGIKSFSHKRVFGFSSLEMMVAIGILATIFILAMPFFSQQGKIIKQLRTSANCQAILDTAFSRINSFGNSLDGYQAKVNPAFAPGAGMTGNVANSADQRVFLFPTVAANVYDPDFAAQKTAFFLSLASGPALYTKNPSKNISVPEGAGTTTQAIQHDGVTLYTPLLLKGSMEYLATKYNAGYCNTFAPVKLLTSVDQEALGNLFQGLKNLSLDLKVGRYDLATNQASNSACGAFWPRPRNGAQSAITYEPQFGVGAGRQIIGQFPSWIQDQDGFRAVLRASYTNSRGQTEDCEGSRDFSLPEDKQNVVDYFYDVGFVKASTIDPTKIIEDDFRMRNDTKCNGGSCYGHPFETILTNLQAHVPPVPSDWPQNRDRPECSQKPSNTMDLVVKIRVYNTQKEPGVVPMCIDTSSQWFKKSSGNWCPGDYKGGAETSFDRSWGLRYTGWVPCEQMQFCNQRPDRVEVANNSATNPKFASSGVQQPFIEYKYYYDKIKGDKNDPRMWGCEMKFGVAMLDMAGNLSYVPAKEAVQTPADSVVAGDHRPAIKEINPHIYFKPPPCYTCNCKPCKGGKGLFGGFFNWLLFVVLVVVSGGLFGVIAAVITGAICLSGGLGCGGGGGSNYVPDSSGGKYRSCDNSNNGCKCGQVCNEIKPPGPLWTAPLDGNSGDLEANYCKPGKEFYYDGAAMSSVGGMAPTLAYKAPTGGVSGDGYEYLTDPENGKIQPGDEIMWTAFDKPNKRFCYVAARCSQGKLTVIKESSAIPGDSSQYPLMGCSPVKVGKKIDLSGTQISQGDDACLEVQFQTGPQNAANNPLWAWSNYNEQCAVTNSTGALSANPNIVAGNCPVSSSTSNTMTMGAVYSSTGPGCAVGTTDEADVATFNFACKLTKKYWDPCGGIDPDGQPIPSCYRWCYAECKVPEYIPEHPWVPPEGTHPQRYYENMTSGDADLPFCTMDKKQFDVGY